MNKQGKRMLETLSAQTVYEHVRDGHGIIVDIRENDEYAAAHIEGAYLMPLSVIHCLPVEAMLHDKKVYFMCYSGMRTLKALDMLKGLHANAAVLDGGLTAWEKAGLPIKRTSHVISIWRQIQIVVGILLVLAWLGTFAGLNLGWVSLLLGIGLTYAGASGFCGLGIVLNAMPWNRNKKACS